MVALAVVGMAGGSLEDGTWWAVVAGAFAAGDGGAVQEAAPSVRHEIVRPPTTPAAVHDARGLAPGTNPGIEEGDREASPPGRRGRLGALVRSYYAALDAHEYEAAWLRLSPAVQAAFGGLDPASACG